MKIFLPTADQIVKINQLVCAEGGNPHHCFDVGKIESSLFTAFYPGEYPFAAGGITSVAGALCFYLTKNHVFMDGNKRTATITAIAFMKQNGWNLRYPFSEKTGANALAEIVDQCAAGEVSKDELMKWFENHKVRIEK